MSPIDPLKLQRLIDGELDVHDTQEILRSADKNPGLWQSIATSFVENQLWQNQFKKNVDGFRDYSDGPETVVRGFESNIEIDPVRKKSAPFSSWHSLAAAMLLALGIGYFGGQLINNDSSISNPSVASNELTTADTPPFVDQNDGDGNAIPGVQPVEYRPDYHLKLENEKGEHWLGSEIPLYKADKDTKLDFMRAFKIPNASIDHWHKSGFRINQDIQFMTGRLKDGRRFVVPIQRIYVSPGQ